MRRLNGSTATSKYGRMERTKKEKGETEANSEQKAALHKERF
jgi:hypothetical protein